MAKNNPTSTPPPKPSPLKEGDRGGQKSNNMPRATPPPIPPRKN